MRSVERIDGDVRVSERPDPAPAAGQVVVRMRAAGLNISDKPGDRYAGPRSADWVPGLELAGERVDSGELVLGLVEGGAHAELVAVDERHLVPLPDGVDLAAGAGFLEAFTTAHNALVTLANVERGARVLVSGSVATTGLASVQVADALGATVTADLPGLTRAPEHANAVEYYSGKLRELGAAEVVVPGEADGPFDVILHVVGDLGQTLPRLARNGRIVLANTEALNTTVGGSVQELDLGVLMRLRGTIQSSLLRAMTPDEKADAVAAATRDLLPLLAAGRIGMPVDSTFPLSEASAAFARFDEAGKWGKVVLTAP